MAGRPAMVLPPLDPREGAVTRDTADLFDDRVPPPFHRYGDEHWARPVGYYQGRRQPGPGAGYSDVPGPCNPTGSWASNRHLFDALMSEEGDVYEGDDLRPSRFRLVLTCVRCGAVRALAGQLDAEGGDRDVTMLDPVPLQAGPLLAQQIHYEPPSWGVDSAQWTIYRDGQLVGWMATERGQRGARYVAGALGRRGDSTPAVKAPTAIAVLRKLAKVDALAPAGR